MLLRCPLRGHVRVHGHAGHVDVRRLQQPQPDARGAGPRGPARVSAVQRELDALRASAGQRDLPSPGDDDGPNDRSARERHNDSDVNHGCWRRRHAHRCRCRLQQLHAELRPLVVERRPAAVRLPGRPRSRVPGQRRVPRGLGVHPVPRLRHALPVAPGVEHCGGGVRVPRRVLAATDRRRDALRPRVFAEHDPVRRRHPAHWRARRQRRQLGPQHRRLPEPLHRQQLHVRRQRLRRRQRDRVQPPRQPVRLLRVRPAEHGVRAVPAAAASRGVLRRRVRGAERGAHVGAVALLPPQLGGHPRVDQHQAPRRAPAVGGRPHDAHAPRARVLRRRRPLPRARGRHVAAQRVRHPRRVRAGLLALRRAARGGVQPEPPLVPASARGDGVRAVPAGRGRDAARRARRPAAGRCRRRRLHPAQHRRRGPQPRGGRRGRPGRRRARRRDRHEDHLRRRALNGDGLRAVRLRRVQRRRVLQPRAVGGRLRERRRQRLR
mmetsp:Transcript_22801/g.70672  ORF Transcript_22801/g.70672 Transcript_22801/m.70672 type:complete len:492 (+) Transcript_22801:60-1535(+)